MIRIADSISDFSKETNPKLERFSLDCRKTKTKVNTLANQRA